MLPNHIELIDDFVPQNDYKKSFKTNTMKFFITKKLLSFGF